MSRSRLLLFGDQSVEKLEPIRKLVHSSKHSQTLRRFLREAADVVQAEVAKLGPAEKAAFYGFDDLLALAEQNASEDTPNEICATALICIIRIGELLLYGCYMSKNGPMLTYIQVRGERPRHSDRNWINTARPGLLYRPPTRSSSIDVSESNRFNKIWLGDCSDVCADGSRDPYPISVR